jgi:hypothetical protein
VEIAKHHGHAMKSELEQLLVAMGEKYDPDHDAKHC